jgi:hypothetical protein
MKFSLSILLLFSLAIFLPTCAQNHPNLPATVNNLQDFVPKDWKIAEKLEGDLNSDGIAETVLVLQGANQDLIKKSEYLDYNVTMKDEKSGDLKMLADNNPVSLVILSKGKDGYKLLAQNNQIIPQFVDNWYRWKHAISLENKTLKVQIAGKVSASISDNFGETIRVYQFQMHDANLVLTEAEETYWFQAMLARNGRKDKYEKHDFITKKGFIVSKVSIDRKPVKEESRKIDKLIDFEQVTADSIEAISKMQIGADENTFGDFDKLVFEYKDSSKSPAYQRNYKITVTKTSASIILTADRVLAESTIKLTKKQFDRIVKKVRNADLKSRQNLDDDGCSGGTSDIFEFFGNREIIFKGLVYNCGTGKYGDLTGDSESIKKELISLFPKVKAKFVTR